MYLVRQRYISCSTATAVCGSRASWLSNTTNALSSSECRTWAAKCLMYVRKPSDVIQPEGWGVPVDPTGAPLTIVLLWGKRTSSERCFPWGLPHNRPSLVGHFRGNNCPHLLDSCCCNYLCRFLHRRTSSIINVPNSFADKLFSGVHAFQLVDEVSHVFIEAGCSI